MKYIRIYVGAEDIKKGRPNQGNSCPIARAIKRYTGTARPNVDGGTCRIRKAGKLLKFNLPKTAQAFITQFDWHNPVQPFSFRLTPKLKVA